MTVFSGASLLVFREKTHGAMAALLTTPLRPLGIFDGKAFSHFVFRWFLFFRFCSDRRGFLQKFSRVFGMDQYYFVYPAYGLCRRRPRRFLQ